MPELPGHRNIGHHCWSRLDFYSNELSFLLDYEIRFSMKAFREGPLTDKVESLSFQIVFHFIFQLLFRDKGHGI